MRSTTCSLGSSLQAPRTDGLQDPGDSSYQVCFPAPQRTRGIDVARTSTSRSKGETGCGANRVPTQRPDRGLRGVRAVLLGLQRKPPASRGRHKLRCCSAKCPTCPVVEPAASRRVCGGTSCVAHWALPSTAELCRRRGGASHPTPMVDPRPRRERRTVRCRCPWVGDGRSRAGSLGRRQPR